MSVGLARPVRKSFSFEKVQIFEPLEQGALLPRMPLKYYGASDPPGMTQVDRAMFEISLRKRPGCSYESSDQESAAQKVKEVVHVQKVKEGYVL